MFLEVIYFFMGYSSHTIITYVHGLHVYKCIISTCNQRLTYFIQNFSTGIAIAISLN